MANTVNKIHDCVPQCNPPIGFKYCTALLSQWRVTLRGQGYSKFKKIARIANPPYAVDGENGTKYKHVEPLPYFEN